MRLFPDFRRSDGYRTPIGDLLVRRMVGVIVTTSGNVLIARWDARHNRSFTDSAFAQTDRFGARIGRWRIGWSRCAMSRVIFKIGPVFVGRP